jgi:Uma2 family endonuclease
MVQYPAAPAAGLERLRYHRAPRPLVFPTEAIVPETKRHLRLRTALFDILRLALGPRACIGSEQFVYYDAADPSRCLSPDVFVRLGTADFPFDTWMVWKLGAPEVAVEIVSDDDRPEGTWSRKLARYHQLGVLELVRFDPDATGGERVRVWDRVGDDLVERVVERDLTPCQPLGLWWVVAPLDEQHPMALRLARDPQGVQLLLTADERAAEEQRRAAEEQRRAAEEQRRAAEERHARTDAERARDEALRRVSELEAELERRR